MVAEDGEGWRQFKDQDIGANHFGKDEIGFEKWGKSVCYCCGGALAFSKCKLGVTVSGEPCWKL